MIPGVTMQGQRAADDIKMHPLAVPRKLLADDIRMHPTARVGAIAARSLASVLPR